MFYFISKETQEKYFELMNYFCRCPVSLLLTASLVENKTKDFQCCQCQNLPLDTILSDFLSHTFCGLHFNVHFHLILPYK